MVTPVLNRRWSREVDRRAVEQYGMSGLVLMENAGRGVADRLCQLGIDGPVVIACGKGNNAGDGFVIARQLDLRGYHVRTLLFADPDELRGDAAANFAILSVAGLVVQIFSGAADASVIQRAIGNASWTVDALLGTGATGVPRSPIDQAILAMNSHPAPVMAVDVPSGLDCDTGQTSPTTIEAVHTCTFVAQKPGFLMPSASRFTGIVHVLDIGVPRRLLEEIFGEAAATEGQ